MDTYLSKINVPQEIWYKVILYLDMNDSKNLLIFLKY